MFSCCTVLPGSKETELRSSDQEASLSAGKNTGVVLVPCRTWKCVPTAISVGVDISEVPVCHLLRQMISQWGSEKLFQGLVFYEVTAYLSVSGLFLTQWIMTILSKRCKSDSFESHNSNIWGFCSILFNLDFSLNQTKSCSMWDRLGWLNCFWQFLCEGLSSFNSKRFYYLYAWSCS